MNIRSQIGGNNPPDPIDEALAPYADDLSEAENWLDGSPVETEAQMKAVDALLKNIKAAKKDVGEAEESEAKPIYDQWKAAKARFKPTLDDLDRIAKGLASTVNDFKRKLAEQKEAKRREAAIAAARAQRDAEEAAKTAAASDIEAQREAAEKLEQAREATKQAQAAGKDTVKGLRTVTRFEVTDMRDVVNWIARNDKGALAEFAQEYVRRNHKDQQIAGVRVWQEREAF